MTALSGDLYHEIGNTIDKALHKGGFVDLPQDMPHSLWSVGAVEIQVSGSGPFGVNHIDPADDPSKKSRGYDRERGNDRASRASI